MTSLESTERALPLRRSAALALLRPLAALFEQDEEARSLRLVRRGDRLTARMASADGASVPAKVPRSFDPFALQAFAAALRRLVSPPRASFRAALDASWLVDIFAGSEASDKFATGEADCARVGGKGDEARVEAMTLHKLDAAPPATLDALATEGFLTADQAKRLRGAIAGRQGVVVGGPASCGKTKLLRALAAEAARNGEVIALCDRSGEIAAGWDRDAEPPLSVEPERLADAVALLRPGYAVAGDFSDGDDALLVLLATAGSATGLFASLDLGPRATPASRIGALAAAAAASRGLRLPDDLVPSAFSLHASMERGEAGPRLKDLFALAR